MTADVVVHAEGLVKDYPGVRALDGVDLGLRSGRVHALLGENGAGKSTLVRCLTGNTTPTSGTLRVAGQPRRLGSPRDALDQGICAVYQELTVLPYLSVADNVMLGQERSRRGVLRRRHQREVAGRALARVGLDRVDPRAPAGELSLANQQLVEIARALVRDPRVLILDEPSAVLSSDKLEALHRVVRELADSGHAILYITHLLDEVAALADDVTVLRDGRTVSSGAVEDYPVERIVTEMVGREVESLLGGAGGEHGDVVLSCAGLRPVARTRPAAPLDLEVRAGEIVGLAGLVGSGRSRMLRTIAGAHPRAAGKVRVDGVDVGTTVRDAVGAGVVLVPEERKTDGLILDMTLGANVTLTTLSKVSRLGHIDARAEADAYWDEARRLRIRATGPAQRVGELSGGNQQKAVIAKWLRRDPRVLVMDEPTRGVDVGAKAEIYRIIRDLAAEGRSVVFASSELPEVLGLADRVLVFRGGGLAGELTGERRTEADVMRLAMGAEVA
ncbi:sugar ABC transporter ATP-binding protein [Nocardioides sp. BYT-33-1]|uniref:sugar ABC transporter ATP-binding protein n=1 Tax=Nocardioides sp. BYT-33-1 TaxID=3416952 RepID=UPI003F52A536